MELMDTPFRVERVRDDLPFGVIIHDFDPESLSHPEIGAALRKLWIQEGVVVFRKLEGADTQVALSKVFGDPIPHPVREGRSLSRPELATIRYQPSDGWLIDVDGEELGQWLPWHSDLVYLDQINHGGILRPIALPDHLGQTGFIDQITSCDHMPTALLERIQDLEVIYKYDLEPAHQKFGRTKNARTIRFSNQSGKIQSRIDEFPRVYHPMIYTQAETGRKVLNVSPWFAVGIRGMENAEGDALLHEVVEYVVDERFAYFHDWRSDDMVLWDNWRMLHSAAGSPPDQQRWLERTTILGDYGLGRRESESSVSQADYIHV